MAERIIKETYFLNCSKWTSIYFSPPGEYTIVVTVKQDSECSAKVNLTPRGDEPASDPEFDGPVALNTGRSLVFRVKITGDSELRILCEGAEAERETGKRCHVTLKVYMH